MNYDGAFGGRPAPSLAEAMMSAQIGYSSMNSPCTTPNAFSGRFFSRRLPSYSQQPINCTFDCYDNCYGNEDFDSDIDEDEIYTQREKRLMKEKERKRKEKQDKFIQDVEKTVCNKLESSLNQHYKMMKSKIKSVQEKVESTDASIERLNRLLDSITESVIAMPNINATVVTPQRKPATQPTPRTVMTWKRKKSGSGRTIMSQAQIDSMYF